MNFLLSVHPSVHMSVWPSWITMLVHRDGVILVLVSEISAYRHIFQYHSFVSAPKKDCRCADTEISAMGTAAFYNRQYGQYPY